MKYDRVGLIRALIRAKNAFCDSLEKDGYCLAYPVGGGKTARILKKKESSEGNWPLEYVGLGDITIGWALDYPGEDGRDGE